MEFLSSSQTQKVLRKMHTLQKRVRQGYGVEIHPRRDWKILLVVVVLLVIISLGMNSILFLRVLGGWSLSEDAFSSHALRTPQEEDIATLDALFELRRVRTNTFVSGEIPFVDPSR